VPPSRPLAAWQYFLNWDTDVIDVDVHNPYFLILVSGGAQPFTIVEGPLPDISSPFPAAVSDAGPGDIGAGVLARVIIEGNAAGIAKLSLSNVQLFDISGNPIPVDAINGAQVNVSKDGPDAGTTIGDSPGELFPCSSVDQVSIDMGPPGVANGVERNGKPAVGDRSGDGIVDAEGYNTPDPGDTPGACGNGIDDDQADTDGDTVPGPGGFDGVADDGCVVTLSQRETCAEIIDDDVLNADEDQLTSGQDRLRLDVTVGAQPGPGGGIPATRLMKAWQYSLRWTPDLIDVDLHSEKFLILAAGGQQPVTVVTAPTPLQNPPFTAAVSDAGPKESGPGVLARVTIEGREPGVADLTLSDVTITDYISHTIPIDALNSARIAVSKDGPDEGTSIGDSPGERFRCSGPEYPDDDSDGVYDVDEQACGSNPLNSTLRPERLDGPFAGVDDDGDGSTDEPLPPSREGFDCDGDGWIGRWEMDVFGVVGTSKDQDPCGNDGWPSDLIGIDNSLTIADIRSFLAPIRMDGSFNKFSHPVPDDEDPSVGRWDLRQPTNGVIDIADLNRLNPGVNTNMARPPMFGGQPAFFTNLGQCPWPP
jgi:hypothetical protein